MTVLLEISLALSVVVGGIGRPLTRWISEYSHTRRQRDALDTLERLALRGPSTTSANLVPTVVRATGNASAPGHDETSNRGRTGVVPPGCPPGQSQDNI